MLRRLMLVSMALLLSIVLASSAFAYLAVVGTNAQNDKAYNLTATQAAALSALTGQTIVEGDNIELGQLRPLTGIAAIGDNFDAASVIAAKTSGTPILAVLNAFSTDLSYTGAYQTSETDPTSLLGNTTINSLYTTNNPPRSFNAYWIVWKDGGNLVFQNGTGGTSTFSVAGTAAAWPGSAVPIPAAVWLLGSGLIGLVGLRRRFKK